MIASKGTASGRSGQSLACLLAGSEYPERAMVIVGVPLEPPRTLAILG